MYKETEKSISCKLQRDSDGIAYLGIKGGEQLGFLSADILEMEIMPDHVHILMEVDPQFGIHKAVKSLKGYTSKVLRQEFPFLRTKMPTLWTNSYFVSTVGGAPLEAIKQYIENQKTSQRDKGKLG